MTDTHTDADSHPGYRRDVRDLDRDGYLAHQLMLVQTGRRSRAAGIRRCTDCTEPFIDDHSGLTWCLTCRPNHQRRCADCRQPFTNTLAGDRLCDCCRDQLPLFNAQLDHGGRS